nr:MAG TPA: hypothetical protein [Caudoviricetes sp.]
MYKDITVYSRNDIKSEIRVLENEANGIRFRVYKHIDYGNEWLLSCYELNINKVPLETEDMNEAKEKALVEMAEFFDKMVQKYKKAIEELKVKI